MVSPGQIVKDFCAQFATRDAQNLRPFLTPETVFENVPLPGNARITVGVDAITQRLQKKMDACVKIEFRVVEQIEVGNTVYNERLDCFWFPEGTFPKSDQQEWPICTHWEVNDDGKIILWRDYYDITYNERTLGVTLAEYSKIIGRTYHE